ncbi:MAG: phosphoglycerate kinase [Clostridia bacterium]|nr:phosphoglycerate kinase [Clostridia bacterium]
MDKKTIKDIDVYNKKVLLRVDFNVPVKDGVITDDNRIKEELPTIKYLLDNGASVICMSHLGRPEGEVNLKYTLKPTAVRLGEYLGKEVKFAEDCIGKDAVKLAKELQPGEVLMLENLRFYAQEEENDEAFCKKLAKLADVYVNDAFGTAHRKHASTYGVAKLLPNAVGFLIQKELEMIEDTINQPKRPLVGILGGAKVSDKIKIVESLLNKVDTLIVGGAMAYTFLAAQNYSMGKSLVETEMVPEAERLIKLAEEKNVQLLLPVDHMVTDKFEDGTVIKATKCPNIPTDMMGMDIGKQTIKNYKKAIKQAKSVVWNGPMGVFENKNFENGTKSVAKAMAKTKAVTIVGGGDSAAAVIKFGFAKKMTHVSTGGGASLKLFEGKVLPAVDVIANK